MAPFTLSIPKADLLAYLGTHTCLYIIADTIHRLPRITSLAVTDHGITLAKLIAANKLDEKLDPRDLQIEFQVMKNPRHRYHDIFQYWDSFGNYCHEKVFTRVKMGKGVKRSPEVMEAAVEVMMSRNDGILRSKDCQDWGGKE
ncbi:MAG: hypothetical protein L6R41_001008 [Letrouitia leprolyta]|nr:MAG: hypothetical protein L6R41_001008 [Letrouitia leprolyta]